MRWPPSFHFYFPKASYYIYGKRINIAGRISEINKTKDKGTKIASWLATRSSNQDPSWRANVLQALWLTGGLVGTPYRSHRLKNLGLNENEVKPGLWPWGPYF